MAQKHLRALYIVSGLALSGQSYPEPKQNREWGGDAPVVDAVNRPPNLRSKARTGVKCEGN